MDWEEQQKFANEIRRVGKSYYVQTPNRHFFLEPHVLTPFFHFFPKRWQRRMVKHFTVRGLLETLSPETCDEFVYGTRLLSGAEMRQLFPDAEIMRESLLGMTKSWIAVKRPSGLNRAT